MNKTMLWPLIVLSLFIYSCQSDTIYRESKDIPDAKWDKTNILNFNFTIQDTVKPYSVYVNIRNTSRYAFRNLYLFIETTAPEGYAVRDTFECILANDKGRWYGKGWGDIYENKIPYHRYIRFPEPGTYSIEVQQAMRKNPLKHITDIGIIIEEAKNPQK